jgi:hypothetical protein
MIELRGGGGTIGGSTSLGGSVIGPGGVGETIGGSNG